MEGGGRAVEGGGRADRPGLGGFLAQLSLEGGEVMPGSIRNTAVACKLILSVADSGFGIRKILIPDPGVNKAPDPRSGFATRDEGVTSQRPYLSHGGLHTK